MFLKKKCLVVTALVFKVMLHSIYVFQISSYELHFDLWVFYLIRVSAYQHVKYPLWAILISSWIVCTAVFHLTESHRLHTCTKLSAHHFIVYTNIIPILYVHYILSAHHILHFITVSMYIKHLHSAVCP